MRCFQAIDRHPKRRRPVLKPEMEQIEARQLLSTATSPLHVQAVELHHIQWQRREEILRSLHTHRQPAAHHGTHEECS